MCSSDLSGPIRSEKELPALKTKQFESQTMYLELLFVNVLPFLIAVVNPLEYVMVNILSKRDYWTFAGAWKVTLTVSLSTSSWK